VRNGIGRPVRNGLDGLVSVVYGVKRCKLSDRNVQMPTKRIQQRQITVVLVACPPGGDDGFFNDAKEAPLSHFTDGNRYRSIIQESVLVTAPFRRVLWTHDAIFHCKIPFFWHNFHIKQGQDFRC
jgi:hypothetical protein